jgi:prevent-host-death family protein
MTDILKSQFVGMHELRGRLTELLKNLETERQEVVITKQGKPKAVIIDIEKYIEIQTAIEEFSDPEYLWSLFEAKREIHEGKGIPADEVFREKGL